MFPECGSASPELFFELRRRFYLPHDGLPFFDPDWRIRGQDPLSLEDMEEVPEDWVVVLAHRPAKDRSLSIQGIIRDELVRQFGATRVVLFDGKLRILEGGLAWAWQDFLFFFLRQRWLAFCHTLMQSGG